VDCLDVIMGRRSIRSYTGAPVSANDIDTILKAAMAAPSAGNQQSWRLIVVTDPAQLERLSTATPYSRMISSAAAALVVCGDTRDEKHPGYWVQDCSAAIQNALLAIHAIGLGGVWIGVHPVEERVANVREICSVPQGIVPMSMIAIGHPAESKPPAERYNPEFVHRDRW
jgi:nitroreductase